MLYQAGITLRKPTAPEHEPFSEEYVGEAVKDIDHAKMNARIILPRVNYAVNAFVEDQDGNRVWSSEDDE